MKGLVGAHVSASGGVHNALINAQKIGAKSLALFLKNQKRWTSPALKDSDAKAFREMMQKLNLDPGAIVPHGSYLINLGNPDMEKWNKSLDAFLDDIDRAFKLGLNLYNIHPGSTVGECNKRHSVELIAKAINIAHGRVPSVHVLLETMAGQGNVVGSTFEELADIIQLVENKDRIGVCLDTCHIFAAGYDIRSEKSYYDTMDLFDRKIGLKYLKAIHLNDSKDCLGSCKDRHENIGKGRIGLEAFRYILNDPRLSQIPKVLETPEKEGDDIYEKEIKLLESLIK